LILELIKKLNTGRRREENSKRGKGSGKENWKKRTISIMQGNCSTGVIDPVGSTRKKKRRE